MIHCVIYFCCREGIFLLSFLPGWTPLFINAAGLVMEVGGYLTHGSVVSREYGIPAVSCIADATSVLKTGMRVRVDGTRGYVEILQEGSTDERN
mmetsp:Transcript_55894/g.67112  ORF Transcript_55894/g.67112 Transcript_55894/m.67112 type:complete len:94 (+) Transcript_55894:229-510(+)